MAASARGLLDIEVDDESVERMLENTANALDTVGMYAFLYGTVGPWLRRRAEDRFAAEGDDVTGHWKPLEAYTQRVRAASGYGAEHPINKRTGELESYITSGGWDVFATPVLSTLVFPGNAPTPRQAEKVSTAQIGKNYPSTPARPVLGMNEVDLVFVMGALGVYITGASRVRFS